MPKNEKTQSENNLVAVGEVVSCWGLKGEMRVMPLTDFPDRFAAGNSLLLDGDRRRIVSTKASRGGFILKLEGIDTPDEVLKLKNKMLMIPESELHELPAGVYYQFQIIGLEVWSVSGERLGRIGKVLTTAANDVYVMETSGREVLIPAVADVVKAIDLESRRMVIEPIDGLLG